MVSVRALTAAVGLAVCSACSGLPAEPPTAPPSSGRPTAASAASWGPGDFCANTYVLRQTSARTNFSLGSENYKNNDYCAAYPYLKWLLATDPLFTGEDPDDRNFLRMAGVYEQFALEADSSERRVWLDSALATRQAGREAMDAAGVEYESYLRDLVEGFFYFSYAPYYDDAERRQFDAFQRAFVAAPDSIADWYLIQLLNGSALEYGQDLPNPERADYVERLASYVDDPTIQKGFMETVEFLRRPPSESVAETLPDEALLQLVATFRAGGATCEQVSSLIGVVVGDLDRLVRADLDPAALRFELLRDECIRERVNDYKTLAVFAFEAYRAGDKAEGDRYFNRAVTAAPSNTIRADLLFARAMSDYGDRDVDIALALRYDPNHGRSRSYTLRQLAERVGRQSSVRGRINYWCLADQYRQLAATTADAAVAQGARNAASQYERSAPTREQIFFELNVGPGEGVACSITGGTTRVR